MSLSKNLAPSKPKSFFVRKRFLVAYIVFLHILLAVLYYLDARMAASQAQIKRIALSYALEQCIAKNEPKINCSSMKIYEPEAIGFEIGYMDIPHWSVGYRTTEGEEVDGGELYFDRSGKPSSLCKQQTKARPLLPSHKYFSRAKTR